MAMGQQQQPTAAPPPAPSFFLGQEATPLKGSHRERVFDLAWSHDGALLASASEANEARLWAVDDADADAKPPSLLCAPLEHEAEVLRVAWRGGSGSGSGTDASSSVLATATATGRVRLFRVAADKSGQGEGREVAVSLQAQFAHRGGEGQVYALKWVGPRQQGSGDGSELMTALDDKAFFWDVARGGGPTLAAKWEFSPLLGATSFGGAARNPDKTCYIFDAAFGCLSGGQEGGGSGSSPVVCLALSDGSVRIHDRRSARAVATLRRSASAHLTSLCLAPEEGVLVACGGRGEATVYDTRTFAVRAALQGHARPCFGAQVVPRSVANRHYAAHPDPPSAPLLLMTWSSDSRLALHDLSSSSSSSSSPGEEPPASQPSHPLPPLAPVAATLHPGFPIYCAAFSPEVDGRPVRLVLGGGEGHQEQHGHDRHGQDVGGCCDHDHHHHHHHHEGEEEEEEEGPRTLLSYSFAC